MRAGLFTTNKGTHLSEVIISEFMHFGVTVYTRDTAKDIYNSILENKINCLFADIDSKNVNWLKFLKYLKQNEDTSGIVIILFTASHDDSYLSQFVMEGVNGLFHITDPPLTTYIEKIEAIVKFLEKETDNQRKYVRVEPEEGEEIDVRMTVPPHENIFTGKMIDISVAAASVKMDNPLIAQKIKDEDIITKFETNFSGIPCESEAKVLRRVEDVVIVIFTKKNQTFITEVGEYVFARINY